jgi:hypothetical protein
LGDERSGFFAEVRGPPTLNVPKTPRPVFFATFATFATFAIFAIFGNFALA